MFSVLPFTHSGSVVPCDHQEAYGWSRPAVRHPNTCTAVGGYRKGRSRFIACGEPGCRGGGRTFWCRSDWNGVRVIPTLVRSWEGWTRSLLKGALLGKLSSRATAIAQGAVYRPFKGHRCSDKQAGDIICRNVSKQTVKLFAAQQAYLSRQGFGGTDAGSQAQWRRRTGAGGFSSHLCP